MPKSWWFVFLSKSLIKPFLSIGQILFFSLSLSPVVMLVVKHCICVFSSSLPSVCLSICSKAVLSLFLGGWALGKDGIMSVLPLILLLTAFKHRLLCESSLISYKHCSYEGKPLNLYPDSPRLQFSLSCVCVCLHECISLLSTTFSSLFSVPLFF